MSKNLVKAVGAIGVAGARETEVSYVLPKIDNFRSISVNCGYLVVRYQKRPKRRTK